MKNRIKLFFVLCLLTIISIQAQTVEDIEVYSQKMDVNVKNIIILPDGYDKNADVRYPVVYLLHGYGGNEMTWPKITKMSLVADAKKWGMIFVCPDGKNSWYWDSPINPKSQYETYVAKELVSFIDANYKTIASPEGRAITGFSMGGHGALWLAINHQDVFGACGSLSGGVDIRPFPKNWAMAKSLGDYNKNKSVWDNHTVITQLNKIDAGKLSIIFDCGIDDFFYPVNVDLHQNMIKQNIPHDFISRPGAHTSQYWNNAIDYQLLFFQKFFNK